MFISQQLSDVKYIGNLIMVTLSEQNLLGRSQGTLEFEVWMDH